MRKLTNIQVYEYIIEKLDLSGSPYFTESQTDVFLNECLYEWLNKKCKNAELNEKLRSDLGSITSKKTIIPSSKVIKFSDIENPFYILGALGTYSFSCRGVSTSRERYISPVLIDEYAKSIDNADLLNDDYFPGYLRYSDQSGQVLEIVSKNKPSSLTVFFIKEPILFDCAGKPDDYIELNASQQYEIISMAVEKMSVTRGDFNTANFENNNNENKL